MADTAIPASYLDLFKKKAFANLATLMPSGQPQVTPVWVDYDGSHVLINTAEGRQKTKICSATKESHCRSWIRTIPTASWKCAAA